MGLRATAAPIYVHKVAKVGLGRNSFQYQSTNVHSRIDIDGDYYNGNAITNAAGISLDAGSQLSMRNGHRMENDLNFYWFDHLLDKDYNWQMIDHHAALSPYFALFRGNEARARLQFNYGSELSAPISALSRASNIVTVTTSTNHRFIPPNMINITGVADASYNTCVPLPPPSNCNASTSVQIQSVPDDMHFTYRNNGPDGSSSGGTVQLGGLASCCVAGDSWFNATDSGGTSHISGSGSGGVNFNDNNADPPNNAGTGG